MRIWLFILLGAFAFTACYQAQDCEEPEIHLITYENTPTLRTYLDFNVSENDTTVRRRFHLEVDDWFFKSVNPTSRSYGCEAYSAVHRQRYNCEDCPYDFILEDIAVESWSQRNLKMLYLLKSDTLVMNTRYYNYGQDALGWPGDFGFGYHGDFGLFGYRSTALKIER